MGMEAVCSVKRSEAPPLHVITPTVTSIDAQNNRIVAVQAMKSAAQLGNQGNLDEARKVISVAVTQIQSSVSAQDTFTQNLLTDLVKTQGMLQDQQTFQTVGTKTIMANMTAHQQQRSNAIISMVSFNVLVIKSPAFSNGLSDACQSHDASCTAGYDSSTTSTATITANTTANITDQHF